MILAGADGCRAGWVVLRQDGSGPVEVAIVRGAVDLIESVRTDGLLLVDVPVGLPERGARQADRLARQFLGWPRMCSVFSAPIRPVLGAADWAAASRIRRQVEGKGMSRQAWGIEPKVREMDAAVRALDNSQSRVREGHPEVSFAAWAGQPMQYAKKRAAGRTEREALINARYGKDAVESLWPRIRGQGVARDDLVDAFAMLWSAERLAAGQAEVLPTAPEYDATGLRMEIVC